MVSYPPLSLYVSYVAPFPSRSGVRRVVEAYANTAARGGTCALAVITLQVVFYDLYPSLTRTISLSFSFFLSHILVILSSCVGSFHVFTPHLVSLYSLSFQEDGEADVEVYDDPDGGADSESDYDVRPIGNKGKESKGGVFGSMAGAGDELSDAVSILRVCVLRVCVLRVYVSISVHFPLIYIYIYLSVE